MGFLLFAKIQSLVFTLGLLMRPKTKIGCTLGPALRSIEMIMKLLRVGMNVAHFNFSHGSRAYHQETLDNIRTAMINTGHSLCCHVGY